MRNLLFGVVFVVCQLLVEDKILLLFFSNEWVICVVGGVGVLFDWLLRYVIFCQWFNGDYYYIEIVIYCYGIGVMVLCWYCDN